MDTGYGEACGHLGGAGVRPRRPTAAPPAALSAATLRALGGKSQPLGKLVVLRLIMEPLRMLIDARDALDRGRGLGN